MVRLSLLLSGEGLRKPSAHLADGKTGESNSKTSICCLFFHMRCQLSDVIGWLLSIELNVYWPLPCYPRQGVQQRSALFEATNCDQKTVCSFEELGLELPPRAKRIQHIQYLQERVNFYSEPTLFLSSSGRLLYSLRPCFPAFQMVKPSVQPSSQCRQRRSSLSAQIVSLRTGRAVLINLCACVHAYRCVRTCTVC